MIQINLIDYTYHQIFKIILPKTNFALQKKSKEKKSGFTCKNESDWSGCIDCVSWSFLMVFELIIPNKFHIHLLPMSIRKQWMGQEMGKTFVGMSIIGSKRNVVLFWLSQMIRRSWFLFLCNFINKIYLRLSFEKTF